MLSRTANPSASSRTTTRISDRQRKLKTISSNCRRSATRPIQNHSRNELNNQSLLHTSSSTLSPCTSTAIKEEDDNDGEESRDDYPFSHKCVGTTPRPEFMSQKDQSVQISSLKIDEDIRNIPRIGAILNQIMKIKG
jgi:hypothetical protein